MASHPSPGRRSELDGSGADPAGRPVHEQPLARRQAGLGEEGVMGGGEDFRQSARLQPVQPIGHRHGLPFVKHGQLRLAAAPDDRHDTVSDGEAGHARTALDYLAGELEAGNVSGGPGRGRVPAPALQEVGTIQPGGTHRDQYLPGAGPGVGTVRDL